MNRWRSYSLAFGFTCVLAYLDHIHNFRFTTVLLLLGFLVFYGWANQYETRREKI